MSAPFHAWHWPDHCIGKRESRRLRDEHNALFNSHAKLLAALERAEEGVRLWITKPITRADVLAASAAIKEARGLT